MSVVVKVRIFIVVMLVVMMVIAVMVFLRVFYMLIMRLLQNYRIEILKTVPVYLLRCSRYGTSQVRREIQGMRRDMQLRQTKQCLGISELSTCSEDKITPTRVREVNNDNSRLEKRGETTQSPRPVENDF